MVKTLINQGYLPVKRRFIRQLREEYHEKHRDIWSCFLMYVGFMKKHANLFGCVYLTDMNDVQRDDYKCAVENSRTMLHRSRRSGKSLGLSVLAVFFSILNFGYRANQGKVVWRAPATDQLEQAQEWLAMNPFVSWISSDNDVHVLNSKTIDMGCLSSGKAASKGASVLIEDEYRDVPKGLKIYDIASRAEDILAEGPDETRRLISASTGCRLTLFHDHYLSNTFVYLRHSYKEFSWITDEYVNRKVLEHPEDPYFKQQEFDAIWVARGDTAFRNLYIVDNGTVIHGENVYKFGDHPFFPLNWTFPTPRKAGVDFNDSAGHYVIVGSTDDEAVYINAEFVVTTVAELKPFSEKYSTEIESGPFEINIQNAKKCIELKIKCIHRNWDKDIIAERFRELMDKMIIIDRSKCPFTIGNFLEAVFDENARESKLKKRSDQHGLDGTMHMIHKSESGKAYVKKIATNLDRAYGNFGTI